MENSRDFQINKGVLEKYTGADSTVVIPSGIKVIGKQAFKNCESLKNIIIPKNVKKIEDGAFLLCGKLQSVTFPETLTLIGDVAFAFCRNLEEAVLPKGVTHIGNNAFYACGNLRSITIPDSVTEIGGRIFSEGMKIRKCVLAPHSEDEERAKMLLNAIGKRFLALPLLLDSLETNEILLKELKSRITAKKFRETFVPFLIGEKESSAVARLLSFVKKMSAEEIDGYIAKSESAPEIRALFLEYKKRLYTAEDIEKMEEIQMEKEFGLREKTLADYRKDFKICKDGNVYKITGCKSQNETVRIPGNINGLPVRIAEKAFSWRRHIREVFIEDGVIGMDNGVFCGCYDLQSIEIPNSVTEIGDYAFFDCMNLQSIAIPDGVTRMGGHMFSNCKQLQSVELSRNVTEIGEAAFFHCESLQAVVLPESVTNIANMVFSHCVNLRSVTVSDRLTNIGNHAFARCTRLECIHISKNVENINGGSFLSCKSLQNITIPEGVESIENFAFYDCKNLEQIWIPCSVTNIGSSAFAGCKKLTFLCAKKSYAERYAKKNGIPFKTI